MTVSAVRTPLTEAALITDATESASRFVCQSQSPPPTLYLLHSPPPAFPQPPLRKNCSRYAGALVVVALTKLALGEICLCALLSPRLSRVLKRMSVVHVACVTSLSANQGGGDDDGGGAVDMEDAGCRRHVCCDVCRRT